MNILRNDALRRDRFKPSAIPFRRLRSRDCDQIDRCRAKIHWRIDLRPRGANIPERVARAGVFAQSVAATRAPQMGTGARVDIGKEIFIYCAAMMVKTEVHPLSVRAHVAAGIVVHGDVVNELGAKIKIGKEIIFALKAKAVMARAAELLIGRAG